MEQFLIDLGLGPILLYIGVILGSIGQLLKLLWELVKYILVTLTDELDPYAYDGLSLLQSRTA